MEPRKGYRSDIDGLRGLAIAGVLIYHANPGLLPGGFLGVDIFFVISGFLVGGLVLDSLRRKEFSFQHFYLRRARRLLPALFLVLIVTAVAALLFLPPDRLEAFSNSLIFATLGLSNMYFLFQDSYWSDASETVPLLHTWSLGVEEQFYLLFPVIAVFAHRFFSLRLLAIFSSLALSSFLLSLIVASKWPALAFYSFPTRAWELIVGVVLALLVRRPGAYPTAVLSSILVLTGLGMIAMSYFYLGPFVTSPGVFSTVPVLGAALVIFGGLNQNSVSKVLNFRPLVGLGLISYSLYLWHFPILAIPRAIVGDLTPALALLAIFSSVAASILSFLFVERPFRRNQKHTSFFAMMAAGGAVVLVFGLVASGTSGFAGRTWGAPRVEIPELPEMLYQSADASENAGNLLVLGDSQAGGLVSSLEAEGRLRNMAVHSATQDGCYFILGVRNLDSKNNLWHSETCGLELQDMRLSWANEFPPSIVVINGRLPLYLGGSRFDNGQGGVEGGPTYLLGRPGDASSDFETRSRNLVAALHVTVERLVGHGHTVVLVYPIPEHGWDVTDEINRRGLTQMWPRWPLEVPVTISASRFFSHTQAAFEALDGVKAGQIVRVYPHELFCTGGPKARCVSHSEDDIFYFDDNHLSTAGNELLAGLIYQELEAVGAVAPRLE